MHLTLKNRSGSTLIMVLLAVGLVGLMTLAAIRTSSFMDKDAVRTASVSHFDSFSQAVTSLLSNPNLCLNGVAGLHGLQFSGGNFDPVQAATKAGQDISTGSHFSDSSGNAVLLAAGTTIPSMQLSISRIYIKSPPQTPIQPAKTYTATLMATVISTASDQRALGERTVANINLQVDPSTGVLLSCSTSMSAPGLCSQMGCNYNASAADQKCVCPLPNMACPSGQLVGADGTDPVCRDYSVNCPANQFLSGFDSAGQPVCQFVQAAKPKTPTVGLCNVRLCMTPSDPSTCWVYQGNMRMDDCYNHFLTGDRPTAFQDYYFNEHNCPGSPNTYGGPWPSGGVGVEWFPPPGVNCTIHGEEQNDSQCGMQGVYMHNVYTCSDGDNGWWDILGWCTGHTGGQSCLTEVPLTDPCPAGSSIYGLGANAAGSCNCIGRGSTWNGSTCVGGNPCPPDGSLTGTGDPIDGAPGCKCGAGQSFTGAKCVPYCPSQIMTWGNCSGPIDKQLDGAFGIGATNKNPGYDGTKAYDCHGGTWSASGYEYCNPL